MKKKIGVFLISFFLILSFSANIVFGIIIIKNPSTETIFKSNISKVVEIKSSSDEETWGYATGCFINTNQILTNKHVVYNQSEQSYYKYILVRLPSDKDFKQATIVDVSGDSDLALIEISYHNNTHFSLADNVKEGETVYTIGNPNGLGLSFVQGVVSCNYKKVTNENISITALQLSMVINEGNSGGPVFNKQGQLIGLISFRLKDKFSDVIQGVSFAVPFEDIQLFLQTVK